MTSMRQVWRALPGPNPKKCECYMFFCISFANVSSIFVAPKQADAHDADDAGSWGAAGRLRGVVNPDKPFKIHAVGNVSESMTFLIASLWF